MSIILQQSNQKFMNHNRSLTIKEQSPKYIQHDQLFKQLIQHYFKEFIQAFFPQLYDEIDFSEVTFLSEETFTETFGGEKQLLDIVVQVRWKSKNTMIVIHVEPQSYLQKDFNKRMFKYATTLYHKVNMPVIPIAVFNYHDNWNKDSFTLRVANIDVFHFRYLTLHVRKQNWRSFIKQPNPVTAALLSNMGYDDKDRIKVKLEFFKILTRLQLDFESKGFLIGLFESYLRLTNEEEELFMEEVRKLDNANEIFELPISYVEKGKEIGRMEGREEGRVEGRVVGKIEGMQLEQERITLQLLKKGILTDNEICEIVAISLSRLKDIKDKYEA